VAVSIPSTLRGVAIDGLPLTNDDPFADQQGISSPYTSHVGVTVDTTFRATDANIAIAIPLHAGGYIAAMDLTAQPQGPDALVGWSAPTADSVMVGIDGGFGELTCRRPPSSQFLLSDGAGSKIDVQPLAAAEVTQTALGSVRIFYGEIATIGP
jgi:hypothetical protein